MLDDERAQLVTRHGLNARHEHLVHLFGYDAVLKIAQERFHQRGERVEIVAAELNELTAGLVERLLDLVDFARVGREPIDVVEVFVGGERALFDLAEAFRE